MAAPFGPDLVKEHHNLTSFQRSSHMVNISKTVAQKRLRRSVTIPFATPVRVLVHVEGYVRVLLPSSTYVDVDFPDVHRKYDGKCCGGAGNDTPG